MKSLLPMISTSLIVALTAGCAAKSSPGTSGGASQMATRDSGTTAQDSHADAGDSLQNDKRKEKRPTNEKVVDATTKGGSNVVVTPDSVGLLPQSDSAPAGEASPSTGSPSLVATIGATTPPGAPTVTVPLGDLASVPLTPNTPHHVVIAEQQASGELKPIDELSVATPPRSPEVLRVETQPNGNVAVYVDVHDNPAGTDLALLVTASGSGEVLGAVDVATGGAAKPGQEFGDLSPSQESSTPPPAPVQGPAGATEPAAAAAPSPAPSSGSEQAVDQSETPSNVVVIIVDPAQLPAPVDEVEFSVQAQSDDDTIVTDPSDPVGVADSVAEEAADNEAVQTADEAIGSDDGVDAQAPKDSTAGPKAELQALRDGLRKVIEQLRAARQELKAAHAELRHAKQHNAANIAALETVVQSIRDRILALKKERAELREKIKGTAADVKKAKKSEKAAKDKDDDGKKSKASNND